MDKNFMLPGETIRFQANPHWIALAGVFIRDLVLILSIIIVYLFLTLKLEVQAGWLLVVLLYPVLDFAWKLLVWTHLEYLVTDRRIVKKQGVINQALTEIILDKVTNVSLNQSAFARLLNYGDIVVETASEQGVFRFPKASRPLDFRKAVSSGPAPLNNAQPRALNTEDSNPPYQDIPALLRQLKELSDQGAITPEEYQQKKQELLSRM